MERKGQAAGRRRHGRPAIPRPSGILVPPYRLLFPAAALWSVLVVTATVLTPGWAPQDSPLGSAGSWHAHEMLFGFVGGIFAGYVLTAMRSWTGRRPVSARTAALVLALWVLARLAAWGALGTDAMLVLPASVAFLVTVAILLGAAAWRHCAPKGAVQMLLALLFAGGQIALLGNGHAAAPLALMPALLLSAVGGRIVAAFTWNAIDRIGRQAWRFGAARALGRVSAPLVLVALVAEIANGADNALAGIVLLAAGLAEALRIALWQAARVWKDGLVAMLHLSYLWLPTGLVLEALTQFGTGIAGRADARHALLVGAAGGAIYAVAARAVARRRRRLCAHPADLWGFGLLFSGALARTLAAADARLLDVAAVAWAGAFALFVARHGRALLRPPPRPAFSGANLAATARTGRDPGRRRDESLR